MNDRIQGQHVQVKTFLNGDLGELEKEINGFLRTMRALHIMDVKYAITAPSPSRMVYTALVSFTTH